MSKIFRSAVVLDVFLPRWRCNTPIEFLIFEHSAESGRKLCALIDLAIQLKEKHSEFLSFDFDNFLPAIVTNAELPGGLRKRMCAGIAHVPLLRVPDIDCAELAWMTLQVDMRSVRWRFCTKDDEDAVWYSSRMTQKDLA